MIDFKAILNPPKYAYKDIVNAVTFIIFVLGERVREVRGEERR